MSSKVFVSQENRKNNYQSATDFGEVHFMTGREFSPHSNSARNEDILNDIDSALEKCDLKEDFLCLGGHSITSGLVLHRACIKAMKSGLKHINFLIWDGYDKKYSKYQFEVPD